MNFSMHTINPERGLELKIILNQSKRCLQAQEFETDKYLVQILNDVTIPHALCIEKNIVYYIIGFREGLYGFRKPQSGDPEHRIT